MMKLELQMFGSGSIGAHKGGGGGGKKSQSTTKQAVSNSAPQSGRGSGGGRSAQASSASNSAVTRIIPTEQYTVYSQRGELKEESISGSDLAKAGYHLDQRDDVWKDKTGRTVKIRVTKRK